MRKNYEYRALEDEKGAVGLWDYASEIAKQIAFSRNEEGPIYAEEWGQEIIYNALKSILRNSKNN